MVSLQTKPHKVAQTQTDDSSRRSLAPFERPPPAPDSPFSGSPCAMRALVLLGRRGVAIIVEVGAASVDVVCGCGVASLGDTSPFFPGILLLRKPSEPRANQLVFEKNDGLK